jgi:hypothetical protein
MVGPSGAGRPEGPGRDRSAPLPVNAHPGRAATEESGPHRSLSVGATRRCYSIRSCPIVKPSDAHPLRPGRDSSYLCALGTTPSASSTHPLAAGCWTRRSGPRGGPKAPRRALLPWGSENSPRAWAGLPLFVPCGRLPTVVRDARSSRRAHATTGVREPFERPRSPVIAVRTVQRPASGSPRRPPSGFRRASAVESSSATAASGR